MSCFWRTKIVCFTSFKDQFNPRKWKRSLKVKNFEVVNSAICAIFTLCHCKNLAAGRWGDFPPKKFYFEIFPKTNAISITFGPREIHGQSFKEIDFPTRNAVERFKGDSLLIASSRKKKKKVLWKINLTRNKRRFSSGFSFQCVYSLALSFDQINQLQALNI